MAGTNPTSVGSFSDDNKEYPLERVPDRYPKQFKYDAPISLYTDVDYQHQLATSVPKAERNERGFSDSEIYQSPTTGDRKAPPPSGITAPSLQGGSRN